MPHLENPLSRLGQFMKQSFLVATSFFCHDKSCLLSTSRHLERCCDKILLSSFFFVSASCLLSQYSSLCCKISLKEGILVSKCRVLKKLGILAQSMELECMHLHIMRVGLTKVQTSKDGLFHFLLVVFA